MTLALVGAVVGLSVFAAQSPAGGTTLGSGDFAGWRISDLPGDDGSTGGLRLVDNYRFSVTAHTSGSGGARTGKAQFAPLTVNFKSISAGSPALISALARGLNHPLGELDVNLGGFVCGSGDQRCITYCLYNVQVTNVTHTGGTTGNNLGDPTESATFGYNRIAFFYRNHSEGKSQDFGGGWDIAKNVSFTKTSC